MVRSLNLVITSPTLMPALAAADSASTVATSAPTEKLEEELAGRLVLDADAQLAVGGLAGVDDLLGHALGVVDGDAEAHADVAAGELEEESEPAEAMATLTPMISPLLFTSAPPELPGLMAASVWITLMEMEPWSAVCWLWPPPGGANWKPSSSPWESSPSSGAAEEATLMVRFRVETMPSVTVPVRPSGEPMAMAVSPTLSLPESPRVAGVRPEASSTLMTARSESGSVPTSLAREDAAVAGADLKGGVGRLLRRGSPRGCW